MTREVACHGVREPELGCIEVKRYTNTDTLQIEWDRIWRTSGCSRAGE